ncbi:hypothetical protein MRS76_09885 [Rhizobiaceae bacterium n13]|uniref:Uncharacterized protein n=1 Tax=Ferirhizobium litorale TaxID=2927786 RepID=A0AAE3QFX8_9HYPH|nr:hypothetical protein [Fererhizobium litorale]MDI7862267.1 hypothetical protein [Fererhizobium litorale]MDI7922459.1 hypothetical protein [Fererhizobium litorale]
MVSKDEDVKPVKLSSRDKAAATDTTARAIISAETVAREKKTEKLRALRLAQPHAEIPQKRRRK